jgi:REP-associated tyrosine transposase
VIRTVSRPKRISNYPYTGEQRYFLTICTHQRAKFFTDKSKIDLVVDQFFYTAREQGIAIVAYVMMPDHMHLLVDGEFDAADLKQFVKLSKQRAGYRFKRQHQQRLWQDGYYEHVVRDEERTEEIVYYIIANPVRKGIVDAPMDYPYWGSSVYSRCELLHSIGLRR